jgi:predicted Zn-dependent protease
MAGGLYQAPALELAALTGRGDFVRGEIARFRDELPAPMNGLMTVTEMELAVETKDVEAPSIVDAAEQAIRALGAEILITRILDARGELAENRGDCAAADAAYNRIRQENPSSSAAALGLARCRLARGAPADVRATLEPLLRRDPAQPEAHLLLAKAAIAQGNDAAAREALERAMETWKDADPAYARAQEARELLAKMEGQAR